MIEYKQGESISIHLPVSGRGHSEIYRRAARAAGLTDKAIAAVELKADGKAWQRRLRRLGARRAKASLSL